VQVFCWDGTVGYYYLDRPCTHTHDADVRVCWGGTELPVPVESTAGVERHTRFAVHARQTCLAPAPSLALALSPRSVPGPFQLQIRIHSVSINLVSTAQTCCTLSRSLVPRDSSCFVFVIVLVRVVSDDELLADKQWCASAAQNSISKTFRNPGKSICGWWFT